MDGRRTSTTEDTLSALAAAAEAHITAKGRAEATRAERNRLIAVALRDGHGVRETARAARVDPTQVMRVRQALAHSALIDADDAAAAGA